MAAASPAVAGIAISFGLGPRSAVTCCRKPIGSNRTSHGSLSAQGQACRAMKTEIDMSALEPDANGPDLTLGILADTLADGKMLAGHVGEDAVLLARRGNEFFAVGATCTHYNGPLAEGLMVNDTVRCPWHHACFSLRNGEAVRAPALHPIVCWSTELRDGRIFVREKAVPAPGSRVSSTTQVPQKIVIVGGGGAGFAAAEMLRRRQFQGGIVMLSDDDATF